MNGREIILANVEHNHPPRAGLTFDRGRINDMLLVGPNLPKNYQPKRWTEGQVEYYDDEWGNIWHRMIGRSCKGEICKPAISEWTQLENFIPPDYDCDDCWHEMNRIFAQPTDQFKMACIGGWIFDNARYLRNMEVYFMDMVMYPEELKRLHKMVAKVYEHKIHHAGKAGADGISIGEDMGTQKGLLFSPAMWREYFQDEYTRLFGIAHEYGMKVFMHSCGKNWEILPDLLKAGVDCFQFDQPTIYDLPALAELLHQHHAALWSPVDIQKILPTGNKEIIEKGSVEMCRIFHGELIVKNYEDLQGIGVTEEWDSWAYQAILREENLIS